MSEPKRKYSFSLANEGPKYVDSYNREMVKRTLATIFILLISLVSAGCQSKIELPTAASPESTTATADQPASSAPDMDESAIIALLAARDQQDAASYELHDVKKSGDYQAGNWSVGGQLSRETFWAVKEDASWRLVYLGRDTPECDLLSSWPAEIKAGCRDDLNSRQISNFSQCAMAGGQISETKPRRCLDGRGDIFVEVLTGSAGKRYISQDLNKCAALDFDCTIQEKRFMDSQGCGCQR